MSSSPLWRGMPRHCDLRNSVVGAYRGRDGAGHTAARRPGGRAPRTARPTGGPRRATPPPARAMTLMQAMVHQPTSRLRPSACSRQNETVAVTEIVRGESDGLHSLHCAVAQFQVFPAP